MDLVKIRTEFAKALAPAGVYLGDDPDAGVFVAEDGEPDEVELPVAFVGFPNNINFDQNLRGGTIVEFEVFLLVDRAEAPYAQLRLASAASLVDTRASIEAVTESGSADGIYIPAVKPLLENHDPDGAWKSLHITDISGYGSYDVGAIRGLGVVFSGRLSTPGIPTT